MQQTTLPDLQIQYALTHQQQAVARLRTMHQINISQIRIVRLTARQKAHFHVADLTAPRSLAYEPILSARLDAGYDVAQIINTNNPWINQLQQIVTSILVQNALNQATGGIAGGGSCGTDQYGNSLPCNNGGYCGTDQFGNQIPCGNVPNGNAAGSLANVLLSSGIPISSLLGILFSGGGSILNAIVGV